MVFASLGGKLHQHIPRDLLISEEHADGARHELRLFQTRNQILRRVTSGLSQKFVNSYHHQAAQKISVIGTIFEVAAESPEGVVESLESRDGRVFLVQFHPEKPDNYSEYSIGFFKGVKDWSLEKPGKSCHGFL
jgi:gamma-glutamyl-gamma-aminobutyrate hydrolase PuuD